MAMLPRVDDPALLVGQTRSMTLPSTSDRGTGALQTVDFSRPWSTIPTTSAGCAANASRTVYAMGGRRSPALNIVCFPQAVLPLEYLGPHPARRAEVARQAAPPCRRAHHRRPEPKYGLAVTGVVKPGEQTDPTPAPGQVIFLFLPSLWHRHRGHRHQEGQASEQAVAAATVSMTHLNRDAARWPGSITRAR